MCIKITILGETPFCIDCINMVYQQCISLNAHQEHPYGWMPYYTDCIDMVSPLCMTSDIDEDIPFVWNPRYTDGDWLHLYGFYLVCVLICGLRPPLYLKLCYCDCTYMVPPLCVALNGHQVQLSLRKPCYIDCIGMAYH